MSLLTLPKTKQYAELTPAWEPAKLSPVQAAYLCSRARVNYVAAGRRSYKTHAARLRLVRAAISPQEFGDAQYFATGPTHSQVKHIFWEPIKKLIPDWAFKENRDRSISESELRIELWNGAVIRLHGLDKPQRVEGGFWDGGVITEYADIKPDVVAAHISPMRIRGGWIDCEGVPEGRNHFFRSFYDTEELAKTNPEMYATYHWRTIDVLHLWLGRERAAKEIAAARREMDDVTFRQEYEAEFVLLSGVAYYCFSRDQVREVKYEPKEPLVLCFDFNVSPGTCVYVQEQKYSSPGYSSRVTAVLGEVYIPKDSTTAKVCRKIVADWKGLDGEPAKIANHTGPVYLYGDPAGGAKSTKYEYGSDWDIIVEHLRRAFGQENVKLRVPRSAPRVRVRVNAMNSRLCTADGTRHMVISPRAKRTIEDIENVRLLEGSAGELDDSGGAYGHLTAGFGYYLVERVVHEKVMEAQK